MKRKAKNRGYELFLKPNEPSALVATGFLVAGAYDTVGQKQQSAAMKAVVRQDELEDYVGTISQTFFLNRTSGYTNLYEFNYQQIRQIDASMFIQDIWKFRPTFTVNAGLRYEILPPGWVNNTFVNPIGGVAGVLGPAT